MFIAVSHSFWVVWPMSLLLNRCRVNIPSFPCPMMNGVAFPISTPKEKYKKKRKSLVYMYMHMYRYIDAIWSINWFLEEIFNWWNQETHGPYQRFYTLTPTLWNMKFTILVTWKAPSQKNSSPLISWNWNVWKKQPFKFFITFICILY